MSARRGFLKRRWFLLGVIGSIVCGSAFAQAAQGENIAPQALAIASVYTNPINDGRPIEFGRAPEYADGKASTGFRLVGDQPGRFEFYFDSAHPVSPGRCEVLTRMEKILRGHVEILRRGEWKNVATLSSDDWTVAANWTPEPVVGVAVVIENVTDLDHEPVRVAEVKLLAEAAAVVSEALPRLKLSTAREHNVFTLGEEVAVECLCETVDLPGAGWSLHWKWDNFVNDPVDAGGRVAFEAKRSVTFRLKPAEQGPLLLKAWLANDNTGAVVAASTLLVGARDSGFPRSVKPLRPRVARPLPTRAEVVGKMLWGAELYHRMLTAQFKLGQGPLEAFRRGGLNTVSAYQDLAWFEPLPGVFNFAGLDSVVQGAEEQGLGVELGLWHWYYGSADLNGPTNLQYWLEPFSALTRAGTKGPRWLNVPSLNSPEYRRSALRASEVFVRRYREHPSVWIWHLHPFGIVDHDFTSSSSEREDPLDYSPFAQREFAAFLTERYGTIEALNAKYGAAYDRFAAVPLPSPLVSGIEDVRRAMQTFDNRPAWRDYLEFRGSRTVHGFQRELFTMLRRLDPERPIGGMSNTMANSAVPEEVALRREFGVYYGDQNTETPAHLRRYLGSAGGELPFRGEDHSAINPRRFPGDYRARMNEFFFNCAASGVRQLNFVFPVWQENPAWGMFASSKLRDAFALNAEGRAPASDVGLLHSFNTAAREGFTAYAYIDLPRWLDLLGWSEVMTTPGLWLEPVMIDAAPEEDFVGKRLLIDNDSRLLEPRVVAALVRFVERGGDLVLQKTSGQFEPDEEAPTWRLLRALGYEDVASLRQRPMDNGASPREPSMENAAGREQNPMENVAILTRPPMKNAASPTALLMENVVTATGVGPLEGLAIPLRDVVEIKVAGATPVATFAGKTVAAFWSHGRGRVMLFGGVIGDDALVASRQKILDKQPGAWANFSAETQKRTDVLCALTSRLRRWSGVQPAAIECNRPVRIALRLTKTGVSVAVHNPTSSAMEDVALTIAAPPAAANTANTARITRSGQVEQRPILRVNDKCVVQLPTLAPGDFCFVQF